MSAADITESAEEARQRLAAKAAALQRHEPAFPIPAQYRGNDESCVEGNYPGLTKREYLAGLAMQGLLSSYDDTYHPRPPDLAKYALENADALLAELAR